MSATNTQFAFTRAVSMKARRGKMCIRDSILIESCLVAVLGGGAGLGLAWLFISRGDPTGGLLPLFFFPGRDLVIGVGLSLALGLATGIFPALQALRLRVADALRRM